MIEYIKNCWKLIVTIAGALGIAITIISYSSSIATSADLEKVKIAVKADIGQLKKSMELDRDITRLNQVNDSLMKAKLLLRTYPKDKDLLEDIETLKEDKIKIQQRIDNR